MSDDNLLPVDVVPMISRAEPLGSVLTFGGAVCRKSIESLAEAAAANMARPALHPCVEWAQRAGYADWASALAEMKAGKVVVAQGPRVGKFTLALTLFSSEIHAEGLHAYVDDFGRVWLGMKENFSQGLLERQHADLPVRALTRGLF